MMPAGRHAGRRPLLAALVAGGVALAGLCGATPAFAQGPVWAVNSETAPSYLPPGGQGKIIVAVSNLGDGELDGAKNKVSITDTLPAGLTATNIEGGPSIGGTGSRPSLVCSPPPATVFTCTYAGPLAPYEQLRMNVVVKVGAPPGTLHNEVTVQEEGAPASGVSSTLPVTVSGEEAPFGVQRYELAPLNENGTPDTQAGSHPFALTTTLDLAQTAERQPVALPKDLRFTLPEGFIGNPQATEMCTMADFSVHIRQTNLCPPGSVVGVALVTGDEPAAFHLFTKLVPVFNLVPAPGEPARLGFEIVKVPIILDTSVRTGGGYNVVASTNNTTQTAGLLSSQVTLWGVPGDPRHDQSRGWECVAGGEYRKELEGEPPCPTSTGLPQTPLLTLPTSCAKDPAAEPVRSWLEMDSWTDPLIFPLSEPSAEYSWASQEGRPLGFEGCQTLPFEPQIQASPEAAGSPPVHTGATPTGLTVKVKVPQGPLLEANPEGHAEADVRDTTVTLPEGVQVNPSAANGLQACTERQAGFEQIDPTTGTQEFTPGPAACPEASKVANVHVKTPLLREELEGALYLAEPAPNGEPGQNPFDSLLALYLVAEDKEAGVLVKLAGEGGLDQSTGRVSTSFQDTPQLPFEELRVEPFAGQRASLSTPVFCGAYRTQASFTPWSGAPPVQVSSPAEELAITEGCASAAPLAFSPTFDAQSASTQAGAFSPFQVQLTRPDGNQALTGVTVQLPPGVAALLSTVTPCAEPSSGQEWSCGEESLIGHSTAWSGLGDEPVELAGEAYLTTGYDGAPFGLLVRTKAEAGPFDLGYVTVRSRINVNPETAAVTITTDAGPREEALPTMLKGIPVQLKRLLVTVDRPDFEFNPTSCEPMSIHGTLTGSEGASTDVSSPFQVAGCQSLPFAPKLTAFAQGQGSKADGTSLNVKITSPGLGQANIAKVDLQLPVTLSTRNTTLQLACSEAVFDADPAACGAGSVIGQATVHTPVLKSPLSGPAYLVSHGGAAFPDVEFVLQGEGIELILDGKTDIKAGVTYSRFESAPDAPFTSFQTELPAGPHSILTPNVPEKEDFSLCRQTLQMPTTIVAQDGATIEQSTPITPTGCGEVKASKAKKLTRAQLLAKALRRCRDGHRHNRNKRVACERQARERYAPKKTARKTIRTASHSKRP